MEPVACPKLCHRIEHLGIQCCPILPIPTNEPSDLPSVEKLMSKVSTTDSLLITSCMPFLNLPLKRISQYFQLLGEFFGKQFILESLVQMSHQFCKKDQPSFKHKYEYAVFLTVLQVIKFAPDGKIDAGTIEESVFWEWHGNALNTFYNDHQDLYKLAKIIMIYHPKCPGKFAQKSRQIFENFLTKANRKVGRFVADEELCFKNSVSKKQFNDAWKNVARFLKIQNGNKKQYTVRFFGGNLGLICLFYYRDQFRNVIENLAIFNALKSKKDFDLCKWTDIKPTMEDIELIDITLDNDQEDDQQVNSVQTPLVNDDKKQDEDEEEEDEDEKLITIALSRLSKNGGDSFITTENEKIPDAASEKTQSADDFYQPSSAEMLLSEWDEFGAIKDFGF